MKFLKQATHIRYVLAKIPNFFKTAHRPPHISFYWGFFEDQNLEGQDQGLELIFKEFFE